MTQSHVIQCYERNRMKRIFSLLLLGTTLLACSTSPDQAELTTQATFSGYDVNVAQQDSWNGGFKGAVVLKNTDGETAESFEIKFKLGGNNPIVNSWAGTFSAPAGDGTITLKSPDYLKTQKLAKGSSFESGFVANNAFAGGTVTSLKVNGKVVVGDTGPTDPTDPTDPVPGDKLCEDFAQIEVGPYLYQNNTWGADKLGAGESFTQCLVTRTVGGERQIGWTWNWPGLEPTVYSYPEIIYGWKP